MSNISEEQATVLMNHIKFMLDTKKFEFVVYFLRSYDIYDSNISRISSYSINPNHLCFDKFIRFNTFEQIQDYINNCFDSTVDFFNSFFTFKDAQYDLSENTDSFAKTLDYCKKNFEQKLGYDFEEHLNDWFKHDQHIAFFNFVYNKKYQNDIDLINNLSFDSNMSFFNNNLTEAEKTFFRTAYKYALGFKSDSSTQVEQALSSALIHYRYDFHNFERVYDTIQNYEYCINNYLLARLNEFNLIKHGKNNLFTNSLKECINKMIENLTSKKVQFDIVDSETNDSFKLEYIPERIQRDDEKTKSILLKLLPELTPNMLITAFNCKVTCFFKDNLSMQVKRTFMHNLQNYFINNNIKPESIKLIDEGLSKPATGVSMTFKCGDFEHIGINPIKFLIPKLSMIK